MNRFYWILNFILIFDPIYHTMARSVSSNLQYLTREFNCSWIKDVETETDFPGHQYMVAENCLYYYLQDKSNADGKRSNPSMLTVAAPSSPDGGRNLMNVENLEIMKVHLEDGQTKASIRGNFKLSWYDQRIQWNVDEWKLNSLRIMSSSHIWNPALYPSRSTSSHEFGFSSLNSLMAYPNGTVSGRVNLNVHSPCDVDFTEFPYDQHECCFNLYSPNFANVIQFHLDDDRGKSSKDLKSAGWTPKDIHMTVVGQSDGTDQFLHTCLKLTREIANLKIELTLPMSVASLVWLTSSMFGDMKRQIVVKLFAILLEFLCFQFLVQRTPNLGLGYNTPKIFQFYEFTIAITLTNTLITVLLYALSKKDRTSAPSINFHTFFQRLNSRIYCCGISDDDDADKSQSSDSDKSTIVQREWLEIFMGYNVIFSIFASFVYITGIIIIFSRNRYILSDYVL